MRWLRLKRAWLVSRYTVVRLGLLYLGLMLLVAGCQRSFIYFPAYEPRFDQQVKSVGWKEWFALSGDFIGWIIPARPQLTREESRGSKTSPPVLMFHGNAGSASWRGHWVDVLQGMGFGEVRILEYPGYGSRPGRPSEAALVRAALEAYDLWERELAAQYSIAAPKITLFGESLGSGVAAAVVEARSERVGGALLAVPYDSVLNVARGRLPFLPLEWLMKDRFDSAMRLEGTPVPVVIISATHDEIIPVRHARNLRDTLMRSRSPHLYIEVAAAQHNDLTAYRSEWTSAAYDFLTSPLKRLP
jgi:pimeloyl-ACP methyl ester carboxylesterase